MAAVALAAALDAGRGRGGGSGGVAVVVDDDGGGCGRGWRRGGVAMGFHHSPRPFSVHLKEIDVDLSTRTHNDN